MILGTWERNALFYLEMFILSFLLSFSIFFSSYRSQIFTTGCYIWLSGSFTIRKLRLLTFFIIFCFQLKVPFFPILRVPTSLFNQRSDFKSRECIYRLMIWKYLDLLSPLISKSQTIAIPQRSVRCSSALCLYDLLETAYFTSKQNRETDVNIW